VKVADISNPKDPEFSKALAALRRQAGAVSKRRKPASKKEETALRTPSGPGTHVLEIGVELLGVDPPIWRRIEIDADCTFWDLHFAIQGAMGWKNIHLFAFEVDSPEGRIEIGVPVDGIPLLPGWTVGVHETLTRARGSALYHYDLGDDWTHRITLFDRKPAAPGRTYPRCAAGKRACPPEGCGGPRGYRDFLHALRDPRHDQHVEMTAGFADEAGRPFDPEKFHPRDARFEDPNQHLRNPFRM
jgi:hypothetical protein